MEIADGLRINLEAKVRKTSHKMLLTGLYSTSPRKAYRYLVSKMRNKDKLNLQFNKHNHNQDWNLQDTASASTYGREPFSIDDPEYKMDTYVGRFKKFMKLCNPLLLLKSNTGILKMQRLLKEQREREAE